MQYQLLAIVAAAINFAVASPTLESRQLACGVDVAVCDLTGTLVTPLDILDVGATVDVIDCAVVCPGTECVTSFVGDVGLVLGLVTLTGAVSVGCARLSQEPPSLTSVLQGL